MSLKKLVAASMAVALVSGSAFCGIFDYFEAAADNTTGHLSLSLEEEIRHETNIYETATRKTSGYVSSTRLTARWLKDDSIITYKLTGRLGYDWCERHHDMDEVWYNVAPSMFYKHGSWDLLLSGSSKYTKDSVSIRDRRHARRFENKLGADWNWNTDDVYGIGAGFTWSDKVYKGSRYKSLNYDRYNLSVSPYYNLTGKTKVGMRAGVEWKRYHNNNTTDHSRKYFVDAIVDYRATGRLTLSAFAGFVREHYFKANSVDYERSAQRDGKFTPHYGISGKYKLIDNMTVVASLTQELEDNDLAASRSNEVDTDARIGLIWQLNPKFSIDQYLTYSWSDQKDNNYDSEELNYTIDAVYSMMSKRLDIFGGYEYEKVSYDHRDNMDYRNHIVRLGARYRF